MFKRLIRTIFEVLGVIILLTFLCVIGIPFWIINTITGIHDWAYEITPEDKERF